MKSTAVVSVKNVSFEYEDIPVLEKISLDVKQGDFVGVIGPNGGGKTTLLKIILGLLQPTRGSVSLFGTKIEDFNGWSSIGYVAQKSASVDVRFPLTVEEVVGMALPFGGASQQLITDALDAVEIGVLRKRLLNELSGGQQQRVFIARALVSKPQLLILDEPTVGVDTDSQTTFYELLKRLNEEHNLTLMLVSHDIDVVSHEVKSIACINKSIVFHGKPRDVVKGDFMEKVYGKNLRFVVHGH